MKKSLIIILVFISFSCFKGIDAETGFLLEGFEKDNPRNIQETGLLGRIPCLVN